MSVINALTPDQKYSKDGPFQEPVVICDSCTTLQLVTELHAHGMCTKCGNTRMRNVRILDEESMMKARQWVDEGKVDPDWLKLFEVVQ
jgi:hypothetical protein